VEELEVAGDSWQTIVLLARQPGVEVEWLEEAGGSWKAMLLAALLQLGKLLTMHAGGVAAGTWRLLRRRWKVRQGRRGGRGGNAVQQWWRQLRSYVHQQQCGRMKERKGASAEELQGAAAEGAALEVVAAPVIKARGGARGWSGDRVSCWRWWQRVLLVLLVWLVVPAEAAGAAQAAWGVAAAAAAAAAAASTVLNYWAAMWDETTGDLKVLAKGKGIMRIMSTNLRRVNREQGDGNEMAERVWNDTLQAVEDVGVDVWAAQDTGVEDGGSPGQAALWSAGKLQQKVSSGWGG